MSAGPATRFREGVQTNTKANERVPWRVGKHPWRVEAESMTLEGYEVVAVTPFEAASNYTAIQTTSNTTAGTATTGTGGAEGGQTAAKRANRKRGKTQGS